MPQKTVSIRVWVISMTKKKSWTDKTIGEKTLTVVVILIVLFILITLKGLIFGGPNDNEQQSGATQAVKAESEEQQIEKLAKTAATEGDGLAEEVREVRVIKEADDSYTVNVKLYVPSGNKGVIEQTMSNVYKGIYSSGKNIKAVTVMATTDLSNKYGDSKEIIVYQTRLEKETAEKINFEQDSALLLTRTVPALWQTQKLDPAIE